MVNLYYLLIFIFTLGQIGRFDLGSGIVLHLSDIGVYLLVIVWLTRQNYKKFEFIKAHNSVAAAFAIFIFACLISLVMNSQKFIFGQLFVSSLYLFRWAFYAMLVFIVQSFPSQVKRKVLLLLIVSQVFLILVGFIQYFLYPDLRNLYYLGWDEHLYRLFSTYLDPNFAAAQFNLFIFLLMVIVLSPRELEQNKKKLYFGIMFLAFSALLLTYSRSGFLMFASGSVVALWLIGRKKMILLMLAILTLGIFAIPKNLRSAGVELWRTASITARSESAMQALSIIRDHPVFGVGFNTYRFTQQRYGFIEENNREVSHSGAGTDNSFLFVLATTGIVGLSAYLYMWFIILKNTYYNYKKIKNYTMQKILSVVILASIAGLFVSSFFNNVLFYPSIMFWTWTLLGLVEFKTEN